MGVDIQFGKTRQKCRLLRRHVSITINRPMETESLNPESARQTLIDMGTEAFEQRPILKEHIAGLALARLASTAGKQFCVDYGVGRKTISSGMLAAVAVGFSKRIKQLCPEPRVGILLPPGLAGTITNLAVSLAGKTPVNLNYTLGRSAAEACIRKSGIQRIITAEKMQEMLAERFPDFPWTEDVIDVREELMALPKPAVVLRLLCARLLPGRLFASLMGAPMQGGRQEAGLLFTSGSDSEPKGVVLSHRNLIANATQCIDSGILGKEVRLMGNLPIFHSFGFTVQMWTPLLFEVEVVYAPSPLDYKLTANAIEKEKATLLLGTPTFYRPYLKRVEPEKLKSLHGVIAGAEKTPPGFHEAWEERFEGCRFYEGYGLTETAPVTCVNLPDKPPTPENPEGYTGSRKGSVGRLFEGMSARVLHPETHEELAIGETGILALKGPNIFEGYLDDPERTAEMLTEDGWLITGDLARMDADGFLYIEGRLSRFSKIGGEMVPHGAVEVAVAKALGVDETDEHHVAVASRMDEKKGEVLVLLTTLEIDLDELTGKLREAGLPNLWLPKQIQRVEVIPMLASGKLDLKTLRKLAN